MREVLARFSGTEVKTVGDGFLATFSGPPSSALRCARAAVEAVEPLGIEMRAGLHTGECELIGEDVGGMAVHIAARVAALAGPGEVLASGTAYGTVVGSGLDFEFRGSHELRGVPAPGPSSPWPAGSARAGPSRRPRRRTDGRAVPCRARRRVGPCGCAHPDAIVRAT